MSPIIRSLTQLGAAVLLGGAFGTAVAAVAVEPDTVGEATMVIGVAKVIGADGSAKVVDRGTAIHVGDRIETGPGGHVHLRFVDGGRLSVRPSSRLEVENYNRSVDQPSTTAIKFRLDEGVVRSITGSWGEAARDRFRLNTPVAAIGIKGTDFVVKADGGNTLATVYTGAIVLAPLSGICEKTLGPCMSGSEKLLSEDMKGQMLSLSRLEATPQLVAAIDLLAQRTRSVSADAVAKQDATPPQNNLTVDKTAVIESRAADVVTTQAGPAVVQAQRPPEVTQLVWSRVAAIAADGDTISRSFAQASASGFQPTLGNFTNTLYRDGSKSTDGLLTSADTSANFRLAGSAASVVWNDRGSDVIEPAKVTAGSLSVDFAHSTYATELTVTNARIGTDNISTTGGVSANGFMRGSGNGVSTGGALSLDGKEAAYFFEKNSDQWQVRGITLWGR